MTDLDDVVRIVEEIHELKRELLMGHPTIEVYLETGVIHGGEIGAKRISELDQVANNLMMQAGRLRRLKVLFSEFKKYKDLAADLVGILKAMEEFEKVRKR